MVSRFVKTGLSLGPSLSKAKDQTGLDLQTLGTAGLLYSCKVMPRANHPSEIYSDAGFVLLWQI